MMHEQNIKEINHRFDLDLRLEAYKQQREDARKVFEQVFQFSNNAIRGLFILSAGAAVALMQADYAAAKRGVANIFVVQFALVALKCVAVSAISYVSQVAYARHAWSVARDIMDNLNRQSWTDSKRTFWFASAGHSLTVIAIILYIAAAWAFGQSLYLLYTLVDSGKL